MREKCYKLGCLFLNCSPRKQIILVIIIIIRVSFGVPLHKTHTFLTILYVYPSPPNGAQQHVYLYIQIGVGGVGDQITGEGRAG